MAGERESIIVGDLNFDSNILNLKIENRTNYQKTFTRMEQIFIEQLKNDGYTQVIKQLTRGSAILDHIWIKNSINIQEVKVIKDSASDHYMTYCSKFCEVTQIEESYVINRDWKKLDIDQLKFNIENNDLILDIENIDDPDIIAENLIYGIKKEVDLLIPLVKKKINIKKLTVKS